MMFPVQAGEGNDLGWEKYPFKLGKALVCPA